MPRPFPAEFRLSAVALVRAGKTITATAAELGISTGALHDWVRQDQIDRGEGPGLTTYESAELAKAETVLLAPLLNSGYDSSHAAPSCPIHPLLASMQNSNLNCAVEV